MLKFLSWKRHSQVYTLLEELINKTGSHYDLAESFTTMEGIQTLLQE
jgi:hypothetical protein